jgi:hypothetical protein
MGDRLPARLRRSRGMAISIWGVSASKGSRHGSNSAARIDAGGLADVGACPVQGCAVSDARPPSAGNMRDVIGIPPLLQRLSFRANQDTYCCKGRRDQARPVARAT